MGSLSRFLRPSGPYYVEKGREDTCTLKSIVLGSDEPARSPGERPRAKTSHNQLIQLTTS